MNLLGKRVYKMRSKFVIEQNIKIGLKFLEKSFRGF